MDKIYSDRLFAAAENFLVKVFSGDPAISYQQNDMGIQSPQKIYMDFEIDAAMHVASDKMWGAQPGTVHVYQGVSEEEEEDSRDEDESAQGSA